MAILVVLARPAMAEPWLANHVFFFAGGDSAFANAATVYGTYNARTMLMRELTPTIALGVDAAFLGNTRYHEIRSGAVAMLTFERRIVTL
jgi:hypothetical protein